MSSGSASPDRIGPYRIDRRIGRGGSGEVYRAWDERLDRPVALKRLRAGSAEARRRLAAEARALAAVDHPAVVRILDLLESPEGDWLILEWLDGESLSAVLRRSPLAVAETVELGRRVASGLVAIHARGLVHGDLKAENVHLTSAGPAKILDLGLAAPVPEPDAGTEIGGVVGTPRCLAPERLLGRPADARSDLFALGVLLYEALTGRSPFVGDDEEETLERILAGRAEPVRSLRPEAPAGLADLVDRLLSPDPSARPEEAAAVVAELDRIRGAVPLPTADQPTVVAAGAPSSRPAEAETEAEIRPDRRLRRRPALVTATGLAGVVSLVLLSLLMRPQTGTPSTAEPATVQEALPSRVAVPPPLIADAASEEHELLADALRLAALRALVTVPTAAPLPFDAVDELPGPPFAAARAAGADERLIVALSCRPAACRVRLERRTVDPQRVLWSDELEVPPSEPGLAARAVEARVLAAYGGPRSDRVTGSASGEPIEPEDYTRFLELWRRARETSAVVVADEALPTLESIRGRAPRFLDAYLLEIELRRKRWLARRRETDLERALELAAAAAALFPGRPEPLEQRALLLLDAGRPEAAREALEELSLLAPGAADLAYLEARAAEAEGDPEAALAGLRRTVEARPTWRRLYALANLELRQGHPEEARRRLGELLERAPESYEGRSLLAQVELLHGEPERAAELYARLLAESDAPIVRTNLGLARLFAGDPDGAAEAMEPVLAAAPDDPFAALNLADAVLLAGNRERAEALYRRALDGTSRAGGDWQLWSVRAQALAHLGRDLEAVEALRHAQRLAGERPQAAYEAALVYSLVGDATSALAHAERARAGGIAPRWFELPFFETRAAVPGPPRD